ncbi:hypothetical protein [Serratia ureilytica]|uniref:hypothetical protein n=1 Tax=Serratia ureilytica TaxID=300181 RepID=UPI0018665730|nr:hypothetical protein [Serratia ureilytica]
MDKLREEFEQWWQQEDYDNQLSNIQGVMFNRIKRGMFAAWQASRASIVVELPNGLTTREALDLGYMGDYASGVDDGIEESAKVLRSIGLSIKGE